MRFLERDLEDIIFNGDKEKLRASGLDIKGKLLRQLDIGAFGIADLVSYRIDTCLMDLYDRCLIVRVYELKKDKIGIAAFMQALRYTKGISEYLKERGFQYPVKYEICLIGSSIEEYSSFMYLSEFVSAFVRDYDSYNKMLFNYTYEYGIDGIRFNSH